MPDCRRGIWKISPLGPLKKGAITCDQGVAGVAAEVEADAVGVAAAVEGDASSLDIRWRCVSAVHLHWKIAIGNAGNKHWIGRRVRECYYRPMISRLRQRWILLRQMKQLQFQFLCALNLDFFLQIEIGGD
jgi:hypothetical protein